MKGNPADSDRAFRKSTLDRIYTPNPHRDKGVEKMLRNLASPEESTNKNFPFVLLLRRACRDDDSLAVLILAKW